MEDKALKKYYKYIRKENKYAKFDQLLDWTNWWLTG